MPGVRKRISLRTALLLELGFVTSSAVAMVGLATILVAGSDLRLTLLWLLGLWLGSTLVFVLFGSYAVHRLVVGPLGKLTAEADALAVGEFPAHVPQETAELELLATRYRAMAENLLDVQSQVVRVEKLAGIGRLAAGVAHEVRNPLGALGSYVEVLERRGADPKVTGDMHQAIERIERIVQGLVDYARPGRNGRGGAEPATTDLNSAVRTVLDFLDAQGMLRGQQLELSLEPNLPRVRGNQHLLEQVVVNLVVNACQASPGGRLIVGTLTKALETGRRSAVRRGDATERQADPGRTWSPEPRPRELPPGTLGALLFVADDGPGIAEADRERVFDPFFTTKEPGQGTGLGLAIVARTVHESGGTVWVDRAREGGAVFKVFLPIASETDAAAHR
ncbi:MAG TPA: HAMP domain-containing sensor histidine kinase [Gemmatimonadales bacterium]|nr:HAMP domain-containing sensor histidine kinase [Gemmatimonadales bacterium]